MKCCNNLFHKIIIGVFPVDSCPVIIGEYPSIDDAPDGTYAGELAVERYVENSGGSGRQHIHVYEWDGAAWIFHIDTSSILNMSGVFTEFDFEDSLGHNQWEYSLDFGVTWSTELKHSFNPFVSQINVWFRNKDNGCVYTNLPQIPLNIYCSYWSNLNDWSVYQEDGGAWYFGTIDGNPTDANYGNYNATIPAFSLIQDNTLPAPANWGLYSNELTAPPRVDVPVPVYNSSCERHCYQAVFEVDDPSIRSFTALNYGLGQIDWPGYIPFTDPTSAEQYLAIYVGSGILEPSATWTVSIDGNEITMVICTVQLLVEGWWGDEVTTMGSYPFVMI